MASLEALVDYGRSIREPLDKRIAELEAALAAARETNRGLNRRVGELEHQLAMDANERTGGWRRDCLALGKMLEEERADLAAAVEQRQAAERAAYDADWLLRDLLIRFQSHGEEWDWPSVKAAMRRIENHFKAAASGEASEGAGGRQLKVEHPALDAPQFWPLPDDRDEFDRLIRKTVIPWLRQHVGSDDRRPATFTELPVEDPATLPGWYMDEGVNRG